MGIVFCIAAPLFFGQTYFWGDAFDAGLPWGAAIKVAVQKGEPLWWNPNVFAGYSSLGAAQSGWNYPLYRLLYWLLPVATAYSVAHIIHFWLLSRGIFGFCRELNIPLRASLLASAISLMGGAVAAHTIHSNIIAGMGWTGILLWLTARLMRRDLWMRDALLMSAALGLMITVSQPQYVLFALLAMLTMAPWLRTPDLGFAGIFKRFALALILGISLSSAQLLPVAQYAKLNERIKATKQEKAMSRFEYITQESMSRNSLIRFIQPEFFGSTIDKTWKSEDWRYWETKGFSNASLILLAISSALSTILFWRQTSNHLSKPGVVLAFLAIFLMMGQHNPAWKILAEIPPFSLFRIPMRYAWLLQLAIGFLAAAGVMQIDTDRPRAVVRWLTAGIATAPMIILFATLVLPKFSGALKAQAVAAILGTACILMAMFIRNDNVRRQILRIGLVLAVMDLTASWYGFVQTKPNSEIMQPPPLIAKMQKSPEARLFTISVDSNMADEESLQYLHVNSGGLWGVSYFNGYDTLIPHRQQAVIDKLNNTFLQSKKEKSAIEFKRLCDVYSIRWILAPVSSPSIKGFRTVGQTGPYRLAENPSARPAVYAIPFSQVINNEVSPIELSASQSILPVKVEHQGLVRWRLRTELNQASLVVLTQSLYPGWHVTVDGQEAPIRQAENLFMATRVPAGNHVVEFNFDNQWIWIGLRLSQIAMLIWLCLFCWILRYPGINNKLSLQITR